MPQEPAMKANESDTRRSLKERALEELKLYWIITLYLWMFLGLFTVYRRLVVAEIGSDYLHYGIALIEALVIAKVVLIGRLFGFSRRFDNHALIVPVLYKSVLFGLLVMLFGVVEHLVAGWIHHKGLLGGLRELAAIGPDELAARALMLIVAFVPFFAFWELGRVLGMERLASMFFRKPGQALAQTTPKDPKWKS
jgi:hypothetical protein